MRAHTKKISIIFACIVFVFAAFFVGLYFVYGKTNKSVTSVLSEQNNNVQLYFPKSLPNGYSIDKDSISKAPDVSTFTISAPDTEKIFVSIQPKPLDTVLEKFHTEQLGLPETILTPIGEIVTGQIRGRYTASIAPDKSWIIVTAPLTINYADFETVISSFEQE